MTTMGMEPMCVVFWLEAVRCPRADIAALRQNVCWSVERYWTKRAAAASKISRRD